jgi:hypothetical protein
MKDVKKDVNLIYNNILCRTNALPQHTHLCRTALWLEVLRYAAANSYRIQVAYLKSKFDRRDKSHEKLTA